MRKPINRVLLSILEFCGFAKKEDAAAAQAANEAQVGLLQAQTLMGLQETVLLTHEATAAKLAAMQASAEAHHAKTLQILEELKTSKTV